MHLIAQLPVDYVAASNRTYSGGGIPATVANLIQQAASVTVSPTASISGSNNGQHLMPLLSSRIYRQTVQTTAPPQSHYHQSRHITHASWLFINSQS